MVIILGFKLILREIDFLLRFVIGSLLISPVG